jgi:hypothetical protein
MYNTGAINPLQYAQQQRKRKLLWSKTNDKVRRKRTLFVLNDLFFRLRQVKLEQQSPMDKMKKQLKNFENY